MMCKWRIRLSLFVLLLFSTMLCGQQEKSTKEDSLPTGSYHLKWDVPDNDFLVWSVKDLQEPNLDGIPDFMLDDLMASYVFSSRTLKAIGMGTSVAMSSILVSRCCFSIEPLRV